MLSYFLLGSLEWVLNCPLQDPFVLATENASVTLPEAHGTFCSLQRTRCEHMAGQDLVCLPCSILGPAIVAILPASNMSSMLPPWDFISVGTSLSLAPSLDTNHVLECRMKDLWGSLVCLGLGSRPLGRETSWLSQPLPLGGAQCVISGTYKRGNLAAFRPERPPASPRYWEDPEESLHSPMTISLTGSTFSTGPGGLRDTVIFLQTSGVWLVLFLFGQLEIPSGNELWNAKCIILVIPHLS